jgi:hypothetical protein
VASISVIVNKTLSSSEIVISNEMDGDIRMSLQEALDLSLELPMVINNLNGRFWSPVSVAKSSSVLGVEYHKSSSRLRVTFGSGTYVYYGVEMSLVTELSAASSAGQFIQNKLVKNPTVYPFVKENKKE